MSAEHWWNGLLQAVREATTVVVASYIYDHPRLTHTLLHRLADHSRSDLLVLVDKEQFGRRSTNYEFARVGSLRRAGATVELCRGQGRHGAFHKQVLVIDRRVAYFGSSNFTLKSESNDEIQVTMRGPPVQNILGDLDQRRSVAWDG